MSIPIEPSAVDPITLAEVDRLAAHYHRGQRDKSGRPYIHHPRAVAEFVAETGGSTHQRMAALLHDVVEDTEATIDDLAGHGVPEPVLTLVEALTKRDGETYEDYLARVVAVPGAALVKRADIRHNSLPDRMSRLGAPTRARLLSKYRRAGRLLNDET
ncbi:HD domain-containing protein [Stackebrandtia endophytica]|uniref:HD domain-containing protein n=1 Tax=Stackebrandtia endophytica TaxID=1496996 RepID=UPI0011523795